MPDRHASRLLPFAAALVLALPAAAAAQRVTGSFERTVTVTGQPDVEVTTGSGSIEVRTGGSGRIEISGRIVAGAGWGWKRSRLSPEEQVRRLQATPPIEQRGSTIRIGDISDADLREGVSVDYTIVVPAETALEARSGSGSQRIEGVRGGVRASTGSGSIVTRSLGGALSASTGSGAISADTVDGSLRATTGSGSIRANGVRGAMTAHTSSGSIDLRQTGGGDVDVSSSSGTVRLSGLLGGLKASTTSGGLHVDGDPRGEWRLDSSSGTIRVNVPPGAGFEVDARSSSGSIDLGMPVSVVGSLGKHTLKGTVKGGGARLYLRTSSGGIHID